MIICTAFRIVPQLWVFGFADEFHPLCRLRGLLVYDFDNQITKGILTRPPSLAYFNEVEAYFSLATMVGRKKLDQVKNPYNFFGREPKLYLPWQSQSV
mgnify:CR=1 FL=1